MNRDKFDELCGKVFLGTLDIVNEALNQANLKENDIDRVVQYNNVADCKLIYKFLDTSRWLNAHSNG